MGEAARHPPQTEEPGPQRIGLSVRRMIAPPVHQAPGRQATGRSASNPDRADAAPDPRWAAVQTVAQAAPATRREEAKDIAPAVPLALVRMGQAQAGPALEGLAHIDRVRLDPMRVDRTEAERVPTDLPPTDATNPVRAVVDSRRGLAVPSAPSQAGVQTVELRARHSGLDSPRSRASEQSPDLQQSRDSRPNQTSRRSQAFPQSPTLQQRRISPTSQDPPARSALRSRRNSISLPGRRNAKHPHGSHSLTAARIPVDPLPALPRAVLIAPLPPAGATPGPPHLHATEEDSPIARDLRAHVRPVRLARQARTVPLGHSARHRADRAQVDPAQAGPDQADRVPQAQAFAANPQEAGNAALEAAPAFAANRPGVPSAPLAVPLASAAVLCAEQSVPAAKAIPEKSAPKLPEPARIWVPGSGVTTARSSSAGRSPRASQAIPKLGSALRQGGSRGLQASESSANQRGSLAPDLVFVS
jgi:hypothetical protein